MKLRTSFFNPYMLRKNLTRFAPVWILFSVAEVLGLLTIYQKEAIRIVDDLNHVMGPVGFFHMAYALLVAACLFGDLFDSRMCNGLHALPMRREGWLLTNLVSGLVFALIPAAAGGVVGAWMLKEFYWVALVWQAVSLLQFVFFFGLAVFSAMCAGKRLGMVAIYGILNFLSLLLHLVISMVYEPLLQGVVINYSIFERFCPAAVFAGDMYLDIDIRYSSGPQLVFGGILQSGWVYLGICTGVGLGLLLLSWLLYRKRHLETAGDFASFRPVGYFFLLAYTVAMGTFFYGFTSLFGMTMDLGFMVVGLIIGYFTGWMLLERTTKIFSKKVFALFALLAVVVAGSIGLTVADPMGIVTRIPEADEISKVNLYTSNNSYYYNSNTNMGRNVSQEAEVALVRDLHRQMIGTAPSEDDETISVELRYQLKNGAQVQRRYHIPASDETARNLAPFFSDIRSVFSADDWTAIRNNVYTIRIYSQGEYGREYEELNAQQTQAFLEALERDCAAGTMAQHDYFHRSEAYILGAEIHWTTEWEDNLPSSNRSEYLTVYECCENLAAFLETLEGSEA